MSTCILFNVIAGVVCEVSCGAIEVASLLSMDHYSTHEEAQEHADTNTSEAKKEAEAKASELADKEVALREGELEASRLKGLDEGMEASRLQIEAVHAENKTLIEKVKELNGLLDDKTKTEEKEEAGSKKDSVKKGAK